jgi:hypothetical protein
MMRKENGRQEESSLSIGTNLDSKGITHRRARYVGRYCGAKGVKRMRDGSGAKQRTSDGLLK